MTNKTLWPDTYFTLLQELLSEEAIGVRPACWYILNIYENPGGLPQGNEAFWGKFGLIW